MAELQSFFIYTPPSPTPSPLSRIANHFGLNKYRNSIRIIDRAVNNDKQLIKIQQQWGTSKQQNSSQLTRSFAKRF